MNKGGADLMARVKKSVDTSAYYSAQKDKEAIAKKKWSEKKYIK